MYPYLPSTLISKLPSLAVPCVKLVFLLAVECTFDRHLDAARPAFNVDRAGFELAPVPIPQARKRLTITKFVRLFESTSNMSAGT